MKYHIHIDRWEGNIDKGYVVEIEKSKLPEYLRILDGRIHTQAFIVPEDKKNSLLIGGGKNNTYVLTHTTGIDEEFFNLINPESDNNDEVELITGGQAAHFPSKYCITFPTVLAAVDFYVTHGDRDPSLAWEKQE